MIKAAFETWKQDSSMRDFDWSGSTHDSVAYRGSLLKEKKINVKEKPPELPALGDEGYGACGLLTPLDLSGISLKMIQSIK